ncbi:MAG: NAD(P)-dependent oxidoreductase [Rhizomicrobium sp.]
MVKIGFLGLGIMGGAMARNLVKAGFDVTVWNRSPGKCTALAALGAKVGQSPKAVAADCDFTIAMLSDPAAAEAVCFGPDGVLAGVGPGHDYIDMSTVDAETAQRIAAAVAARGARFVEAPVSGTKKPAEDGTLVILAAGDAGLFHDAEPAFAKMGKVSHYLGAVGQAARMKLVANMVMGEMAVALAEGLSLGLKSGLKGEDVLTVLAEGAMACPMFAGKGPMMLKGEFPANFPLRHMQKDLRLAVALGDSVGQPLPQASSANAAFIRARALGEADADMSAVYRAVK